MEISGRVLREVEFRDRLRGYDTEEVDEFLEKVALALDAILIELEEAHATAAEASANPVDDESLRRTLVLAQRTADMAIKEARDEASSLLEEARTQADSLVGSARDESKRLRESAESDAHAKIAELEDRRIELEGAVESLASFVESERRKLLGGLSTALEVVGEALKPSSTPPPSMLPGSTGGARRARRRDAMDDEVDIDVGPPTRRMETTEPESAEAADQLALGDDVEDADSSPPEASASSGSLDAAAEPGVADVLAVTDEVALAEVESVVDPDEELWQRWAKGADLDAVPSEKSSAVRAPTRNERRGRGWSA